MKRGLIILAIVFLSSTGPGLRAQIITTIAGNHIQGFGGAGGSALKAEMGLLYGIAVDHAGNVYAADVTNNVIWKISADGTINLYAGSGVQGYGGDGGPATEALLYEPAWLGIDPQGDLYFSDQDGIYIRKITAGGVISTVAGNPAQQVSGGDGGLLSAATFGAIRGIFPDQAGNLYISDLNSIRKVNSAGIISTIAGTGVAGYSGDGGPAVRAQLNKPYGVGVDGAGNIYIPDASNNVVRKINTVGIITTIAGVGQSAGFTGDGGPAVDAKFAYPWALAVDTTGNVYVSDQGNYEIRRIDTAGIMSDYAGNHQIGYSGDGGPATAAEISYPTTLTVDGAGHLYLTDLYNYVVRKITACSGGTGVGASLSITAPVTAICAGMPVSFTALPVNGGADPGFQWQVNGVAVGTDSVVFSIDSLSDGDVVSCVMRVGSCGLPVPSGNTVTMMVNPVPAVMLAPDTVIKAGQSIVLRAMVSGAVSSYRWMPSSGLSDAAAPAPVATPDSSTTYQLTVETGAGCSASGKVAIGVYRDLRMPNAFTPDGNGKNDVFRIPPSTGLQLVRFAVYNRLGGRVFMTTNSGEGWDGTVGGSKQPAGAYVWVIEYRDVLTGRVVKADGTVMLIR